VAHRFRFQWLEIKLGWSAGAAAWPHAWPLALSRWSLLLAAFTAGVVDTGTKDARECYPRAAASVASSAGYWWVETSFAVGTHRAASAPVIWTTAASTSHVIESTTTLAFR